MSNLTQAALIEELLEERGAELAPDLRERMAEIAQGLRTNRRDEVTPPNIPVDEPIPGAHPGADRARAMSSTGDLPRTDRAAPVPPEEQVPTHEFAKTVKRTRPSVADFNPVPDAPLANELGSGPAAAAAGRHAIPSLPTVEHALAE